MNLDDRNFEDIDMNEEYEMIPFEPMMYGYGQMNAMPSMGMNQSMDMSMGYTQDVNANMDMNQRKGMNQYMGMNQFNEGMFMNGFNPRTMMYGDASMKDYEDENEGVRQIDKYGDKDPFDHGYSNPNKFNPKYNDVDSIVRRIERYNPAIFRLMTRCGMPYAQARDIVRRIVKLTLMYSEE